MSIECAECEHDLRGGHDPSCSRYRPPCEHCGGDIEGCPACWSKPSPKPPMPTPETRDAARVHELKCWPEFFAALLEGRKTFEVRLNDRDYRVGDVLRISEWSTERGYTGNSIERTVTYVMEGGRFGLDSQHVVLGLSRTPETRPVGETANMLRQAAYALAEKRWRERQAAMPKGAMQVGCDCVTYKEVRLIKAELRAALLSGAPTVWVATDSGASVSDLADALGIPPGTVRRYALVPIEEGRND